MFISIARPDEANRGSVEHSEGKDKESVVAISRSLCGSSHMCRLRTGHFGHDGKL
jgi:hypothetical protein